MWYLWQKKSLLQDEDHKQEYIDDVKKSRDNFVALFNQFETKPPSMPECQKTSLNKRSLISGIINTFKSAVDLISCGVDVLNNLVDSVEKIEPPISVVDILTDTLRDIGDELEKENDEPTSTTETFASSTKYSSCTTSFTKTWESVLCAVTAASSANNKRQDQPCTTQIYSTVTGCSAVDSTVTSTTTTTPGVKPTPQCSFESCGTGSTCPVQKRGLERRRPNRVTQPEDYSWAGPGNYGGNNQNFMAGEVAIAYDFVDHDDPFTRAVKLDIGTTSNYLFFAKSPGSLAVAGLYGCTSVIAVSKRGAWASHMWEVPSFTHSYLDPAPPSAQEQLDIFRQQVLNALHSSNGVNHLFSLAELRDSSASEDLLLSHTMDDDADPRVFIFTPYKRADPGTPDYNNEFPVDLPEAWGEDDGIPSKTQQIENEVKAIFSAPNGFNVPYEKIIYAPRQWGNPDEPEDLSDSKSKGLPPAPVMPENFHQR